MPKHWIRVQRSPGTSPGDFEALVFECVANDNGVLERLDWEVTGATAIAVIREVAATNMGGILDCLGPFQPHTEKSGLLATEELTIRERDDG